MQFPRNERFERVRRIGAGGMGVVYEAHDRERDETVALKVLRHALDGQMVLRFKNEFRLLQDILHPNLVRLYELIESRGTWFFTMELVDGVDFLEYVRPSHTPWVDPPRIDTADTLLPRDGIATVEGIVTVGGKVTAVDTLPGAAVAAACSHPMPLNEKRLRNGLQQLADGLLTLHAHHKVHRDIKPSNVLVDRRGRVVLLDFGLAAQTGTDAIGLQGTPKYMAPEQVRQEVITPAADWYSVGVVLYQCLTGRLPYAGGDLEVMQTKQLSAPVFPTLLEESAPKDLSELCMELLGNSPSRRLPGRKLVQRLGGATEKVRSPRPAAVEDVFVGRRRELAILQSVFDAAVAKSPANCIVYGQSGVGKSQLLRKFAQEIAEKAVILMGACSERVSVPYKALDAVIDLLSEWLSSVPREIAASMVPRDASLLLRAFPVLSKVERLRMAPPAPEVIDPQELRTRVFLALRELLQRIACRFPLVLIIEDLQWADDDSLRALREIATDVGDLPLVFLATIRTDAGGDTLNDKVVESDNIEARFAPHIRAMPDARLVEVTPLPDKDAQELARRLSEHYRVEGVCDTQFVAQETNGHPLFIAELIRYRSANATGAVPPLEDALRSRIQQLSVPARYLLEFVCIAGNATPRDILAHACGLDLERVTAHIDVLRAENFVRTDGTRKSDTVRVYHAQIEKIVLGDLTCDESQSHQRLAIALEAVERSDPEMLAFHWQGAGDVERAARYVVMAANQASEALAWTRAAALYRQALEYEVVDNERWSLLEALGKALQYDGHGYEASVSFTEAAALAPPDDELRLQGFAADQLLRSGHIDDGVQAMGPVLRARGLAMPRTERGALFSFLKGRLLLALTRPGLGFSATAAGSVAPELQKRLDLCWSVAVGIFTVDQLRGLDLMTKHLRLALRAGEPFTVGRAFAWEAVAQAAVGGKPARIDSLIQRATDLANETSRPYLSALVDFSLGSTHFLSGQWANCFDHCQNAIQAFTEHCIGARFEVEMAKQQSRWSLCYLGRLRELTASVRDGLEHAKERGDFYATMSARSGFPNVVWLLEDDVEGARREADAAIRNWSQRGFHLQHLFDLYAQVQIDLYTGDAHSAQNRVEKAWKPIEQSGLLRVEINRVLALYLRARAEIGVAAINKRRLQHSLAAARKIGVKLKKEKRAWVRGKASALLGQVAFLDGDTDVALAELAEAIAVFDAQGMQLHSAAAQRFSGAIVKGDGGEEAMRRSTEYFQKQGAADAESLTATIIPAYRRFQ